ncbi:MAG: ABC transporter permease [Bryobacteraceae bacterium]|jgi:NitT/TauT family transport system permease protein
MRNSRSWLGVLSFAIILVAWEAAVRLGWLNPFFTSRPSLIFVELIAEAKSGELFRNIRVSLGEFAVGFGSAVLVGLVLGIAAGWYRIIEYILDPFVWFLYSAPLVAFYPIFVIWFGLGMYTVIAISFLLAFTPVMVNTIAGIKSVNPGILLAARSFGARPHDVLWKVALPASVPMIVAGLRLGLGRALTGVIIGELFASSTGLGYSIAYNGQLLKTTDMFVSLMVIAALGVIGTQTLSALEARFDFWRTGPGL